MCFKNQMRKCRGISVSLLIGKAALLILMFSLSSLIGRAETVDRIMAVVNDEVITQTDVMVVESFGLYEKDEEQEGDVRSFILEKLVDQKLIIQLTGEEISLDEEELESVIEDHKTALGGEEFLERLSRFGLKRGDLREYVREKLIYERIITAKFSKSVPVSLEEIETYYTTKHVPVQKEKGIEPQPMMEILDVIESAIKREKTKMQVIEWVGNLRRKADIQIKHERKE